MILSIETQPVPRVPPADRLVVDDLGYSDDGIAHATARFGYMERPTSPSVLRLSRSPSSSSRSAREEVSYYLSTIELARASAGPRPWQKSCSSPPRASRADAAEYFGLPRERTVIIGSRIEV